MEGEISHGVLLEKLERMSVDIKEIKDVSRETTARCENIEKTMIRDKGFFAGVAATAGIMGAVIWYLVQGVAENIRQVISGN